MTTLDELAALAKEVKESTRLLGAEVVKQNERIVEMEQTNVKLVRENHVLRNKLRAQRLFDAHAVSAQIENRLVAVLDQYLDKKRKEPPQ